jgi:hypothetical protein
VAQRNRLFRTRLQTGVVSKISSDAIRAWLQIDYSNTDIVAGIMHYKINHLSSLPAEQHACPLSLLDVHRLLL